MEKELPEHACGLYLEHNAHKDIYQTVEYFIQDDGIKDDDWVSPEEKEKAIKTNELWRLQWYPNTPVGFCVLYGSTLEAVLKAAKKD